MAHDLSLSLISPPSPLPPSLLLQVFGSKVRVESTAKIAELELAEKVRMGGGEEEEEEEEEEEGGKEKKVLSTVCSYLTSLSLSLPLSPSLPPSLPPSYPHSPR